MQQKLRIEMSTKVSATESPPVYPSVYVHASQGSTTFLGNANFKNMK